MQAHVGSNNILKSLFLYLTYMGQILLNTKIFLSIHK